MHWRDFFIPTSKETPKDATAPSHVLMLRAGLIRQAAAGVYSYLPLGYRVLRKVEAIVRAEMNRAGAIELHLPVLMPISWWEQTGRTEAMGDTLLRLGGPQGDWRSQTVLGPTHEEAITEIARAYLNSYKQLPITLYQIQVKFRGEARPKSGVLRTREFLMKDAYSFHDSIESLDRTYQKMYDAYCRIFSRCGLPYMAVEAESGPIGGDASHEFMVLTDAGEDNVALTDDGSYAANVERATAAAPTPAAEVALEAVQEVHTPNAGRIEDVCPVLGVSPQMLIKTLIYSAAVRDNKDGPERLVRVVALVRGDHDINEHKLTKVTGLMLELAEPRTIEELTGAAVGFAGPQGLVQRLGAADRLIVDREVAVLRNAASGANKTDYHVTGVNPGRDFPLEGERVVVADIRNVVEGDPSPSDGAPVHLRTAIEVGHVFKLGTKYSTAMSATYLDQEGRAQPLIMGCYGIGLNRITAAVIESHHDDNGIIWPMSIAPFHVLVMALDPRDEQVMQTAKELHDRLEASGLDVLFDDRDERAGFKFKDADLIGVPLRIVVGKKSLANGTVEVSHRRDQKKEPFEPAAAAKHVVKRVSAELAELENV
ncbi:MAG: proline--tRNA ligase [Planctomycetes bacterium]|nr:proline--tRNA ligase [Planctomycetota bacterium]